MAYKFVDLVVADVTFVASSSTLEKLFIDSGIALAATQIKNFKSIKARVKKKIKIKADNIEQLLFKFLEELVFLKDKDVLILTKFVSMKIDEKKYSLSCNAYGDKIDVKKHDTLVDVKAVTMHLFEVKKKGKLWKARVVLDV